MNISDLIRLALKEDIGKGDLTTDTLINPKQKIQAVIIARKRGIIAGLFLITRIFQGLDKKIKVRLNVKEGHRVKPGTKIAFVSGSTRAILKAERVVLNFLQRLSGIATLTRQFVDKVKRSPVKILDTRKTVPGWRRLDKYAVCLGGGFNHRMGLYDAILIKDNHLRALQDKDASRQEVITKALRRVNRLWKGRKLVEIEVGNLTEFKAALQYWPHIIMLDNMSPSQIKEAVKLRDRAKPPRPLLEISGGINLKNITRFAPTGVDFISIGALTHSVPTLDISMEVV